MDDLEVAAQVWNDPAESDEHVEARIHDAVPRDQLVARADAYIAEMLGLFPYVEVPAGGACMEIGSGMGYLMDALNRRIAAGSITGLDIAEHMLARAQARLPGEPFRFLHYDGVVVPAADAGLDFVYSIAALQHVPKPYVYNLLFEIKRLLKPTGWAIIHLLTFDVMPDQAGWHEEIQRQVRHLPGHWHHFYSRDELHKVFAATGFGHIDVYGGGAWSCVSPISRAHRYQLAGAAPG